MSHRQSDDNVSTLLVMITMILLTAVLFSWIDSTFESKRCDKLQTELGIPMHYTYAEGCKLINRK